MLQLVKNFLEFLSSLVFSRQKKQNITKKFDEIFFKSLTLRISWTCVVSTNWTGFRVATHGNYSDLKGQARPAREKF